MVKLTPAQVDALAVLASDPAREFEGWKRRSTTEGFPRVNMVAISGLTRAGLARPIWPMRSSPYTHDTRYRITPAGIEEHERRSGGEGHGS